MTERKSGTVKGAGGVMEGKRGKADRGRRLSTPISVRCFILCRAPVSLRPPLAESSFEVIMGLLANAPLQVPLAPSPSPFPSTAT